MTDIFEFQPSEFKIIEEFDFDETVQREERVRFYTLEEQGVDAFEKLIPKTRVTNYQLKELEKEVDRLKDLYQTYVVPTDDNYTLREPPYGKKMNWIFPIYSKTDSEYSWLESYVPLFSQANLKVPGFYNRLMGALPRPYKGTQTGKPYKFDKITKFVDANGVNPIRALPKFQYTKTQRHPDGSFDILDLKRDNTEDVVHFTGYYLSQRPYDIPNPKEDSEFFKSAQASVIETNLPLEDVVPGMQAILDYGVPVTNDPYNVALPYLKIYDVQLSQIPWEMWKVKFPIPEPIEMMPTPAELNFPKGEEQAPDKKLQDEYDSIYYPGVASRQWLFRQIDGGELVVKMLLSRAIDNGSVNLDVLSNILGTKETPATAADCDLIGTNFIEFQTKGVIRRQIKGDKVSYTCVSTDDIRVERARVGFLNRVQWKEDTQDRILREYLLALKSIRMPKAPVQKLISEDKTPVKEESIIRKEVLAILDDPKRFPEDKFRDVQELVTSLPLTKEIYSDEMGSFVLCRHTLAVLDGQLNKDKAAFQEYWTSYEEGYRVCKFCGERVIGSDFLEQETFNADGFAEKRTSALDQIIYKSSEVKDFTTGIANLKPLFKDDPGENLFYLILVLLQVLPSQQQVESVLLPVRTVAKQFEALKDKDKVIKIKGMLGMIMTILTIQMYSLIPRRSFGSRPLILKGYPRDADTPGDNMILDSLISVVRNTFEEYPTSFKGSSVTIIRSIISSPKKFKEELYKIFPTILTKVPEIKDILKKASVEVPEMVQEIKSLIPVIGVPEQFGTITSLTSCRKPEIFWKNSHAPRIRQPEIKLRQGIQAASNSKEISFAESDRVQPVVVSKDEIRSKFSKKIPAAFKKVVEVGDNWRTNVMIASKLNDYFRLNISVRNIDPTQNQAELRDYSKGLVYEALNEIAKAETTKEEFLVLLKEDVTLYTLNADIKEERKSVNSIVAMERKTFTDRMRNMTDQERDITKQLLAIGMAPAVMTLADRVVFANAVEEERNTRIQNMLSREVGNENAAITENADAGPDLVVEQGEQDFNEPLDDGDYGTNTNYPNNDGRDYQEPMISDLAEGSI